MGFFNQIFRGISVEKPLFLTANGLTSRVLLLGIPLLTAILMLVFYAASRGAEEIVDSAIARSARLRAQTISFAMEHILRETRDQLLLLASGPLEMAEMARTLKFRARTDGLNFREVAFMGINPEDRYLLVNNGGEIIPVPPAVARDVPSGPFQAVNGPQEAGHVAISRPLEVSYPLVPGSDAPRGVAFHALRFSTPVRDDSGEFRGMLSLCLDLGVLRDSLSSAPGDGADRAARGVFFDEDGWMMFQSEDPAHGANPLRSDAVRSGFRGDFGRPGFAIAFRPAPEHLNYWTMVAEAQSGRSGVITLPPAALAPDSHSGAVSYAPVAYQSQAGQEPKVIGGVALLDDGFMASAPGRKLFGIHLTALLCWMILLALCLWWLLKPFSRHLRLLAGEIARRNLENCADPLDLPPMPRELEKLRENVNGLLERLRESRDAAQDKAEARSRQRRRQPVRDLPREAVKHASLLVGESRAMRALYGQIKKAAAASADVLVVGETGTGKELVAASIHALSDRASGPFRSINCGALDEALLMDTLFGHVRGAFTEAKAGRKGAFLAASGGTLLLDEIGNAPPKVQKALLRALSTRRIRPLGSDEDVAFDTRIIAATNADLLATDHGFRDDLYYRLAVITLEIPPLHQRREDIPALVVHFMRQCAGDGAPIPGVSQGAMEILESHTWPGNVRELKNVMTRAMAFCDGALIMAEDLRLDGSAPTADSPAPAALAAESRHDAVLAQLNDRQRSLWPAILRGGGISRQEYQRLAGGSISSRTAQYDLGLMVRLGLLRREGRGPSQRYLTRRAPDPADPEFPEAVA